MKLLLSFALAATLLAQAPAQPNAAPDAAAEQLELNQIVSEYGNSPIDFIRLLERHLAKYPDSKQRLAIEKAITKSAIDTNDVARSIKYGERVLTAEPNNVDLPFIDRIIRLLLDSDDPEPARRALVWTARYKAQVESMRDKAGQGHMSEGQWSEEVNKGLARALVLESRATGNLGKQEEALATATRAFEVFPGSEAARERGRWLTKLNRQAEALQAYADAFTIEDTRTTPAERTADRKRMGELQVKLTGSEKGLGDVILAAFDRNAALKTVRTAMLRAKDPNLGAETLLDFTLPATSGTETLRLASLKGKTVVMDFWATWCGPCRVQHPMIETVKKKFASDPNVVFLSVDTDEDKSLVPGFLKEVKWEDTTYFDAGLSLHLTISSIPTVVILGKDGKIASRMVGFLPDKFEAMLTERINEVRAN